MILLIDNYSGQPSYEQSVRQIREQILSGVLPEGEALPSIRSLARDLRVSVITTKRAYEELEAEGWIRTVPGKGSFAARAEQGPPREGVLREIEAHLAEARRLAALCGLSEEEFRALLKEDEA